MYELTGDIVDKDYLSFDAWGRPIVRIRFNEKLSALEMFNELQNETKISIKVKKFNKKRSLDANAYAWVLISKIAEKTNIKTDEVYRSAVKGIGGNSEVVCIKTEAVETLCRGWSRNGIGWQTETFPSKIEGCTNVILYYGSSTFDTAQMSRLISNLQQDCEALNIDTKSPEELASLLNSWNGR